MAKDYKEWFRQSDYDYDTAMFMHESGRYFYAVFMCHLSIEKALKGLYLKRMKAVPPKIHVLNYFIGKLNLILPEDLAGFIDNMDDAGVATRYPETLKEISSKYKKNDTLIILTKAKEVLDWTKEELIK
jgi:HEPN domain-containing protein